MNTPSKYLHSLVVPTYQAGNRLEKLIGYVEALRLQRPIELIVVDDGSPDFPVEAWEKLQQIPDCQLFKLDKNCGQHYATLFGLKHSRAAFAITLDDDLPFSPEAVRQLMALQKQQSADLIYGEYKRPYRSVLRQAGSWLMQFFFHFWMGAPVQLSAFRLINTQILPKSLPENHFFLDILLLANSQKTIGLPLTQDLPLSLQKSRYATTQLLSLCWRMFRQGLLLRLLKSKAV